MSLGTLIKITVPERDIELLTSQSLAALEADFRNQGAAKFGAELRDRGLFTVWTLRKIRDLSRGMNSNVLASEAGRKFASYAVWARFHIDCLIKSMKSDMPLFPAVVENIVDGLRAAVDAYAWLRIEADHISGGSAEVDYPPVQWEKEDDILLQDSMRTIDYEPY